MAVLTIRLLRQIQALMMMRISSGEQVSEAGTLETFLKRLRVELMPRQDDGSDPHEPVAYTCVLCDGVGETRDTIKHDALCVVQGWPRTAQEREVAADMVATSGGIEWVPGYDRYAPEPCKGLDPTSAYHTVDMDGNCVVCGVRVVAQCGGRWDGHPCYFLRTGETCTQHMKADAP